MMEYLFATLFLVMLNVYIMKQSSGIYKKMFGAFFIIMLPWLILQATDFSYFEAGGWFMYVNDTIGTFIGLGAEYIALIDSLSSLTIPFPFAIFLVIFVFLYNSLSIFSEIKAERERKN